MYKRRVIMFSTVVVLVVMLGAFVFLLLSKWRADWCENSAKRVCLSLGSYLATHDGCLPPPFIENKVTGQRHSWRVILLPYLTYPGVYGRYSFQESWNSSRNRELLKFDEYACTTHSKSPEMTNYVAVTGENTLWPTPKKPADYRYYTDDEHKQRQLPTNTGRKVLAEWSKKIVLVELVESDIPWTEPRDVTLDEFINTIMTNPKGRFYNKYVKGIRAIDASGQLRVIDPYDDVDTIRRMFVVTGEGAASSPRTHAQGKSDGGVGQ